MDIIITEFPVTRMVEIRIGSEARQLDHRQLVKLWGRLAEAMNATEPERVPSTPEQRRELDADMAALYQREADRLRRRLSAG